MSDETWEPTMMSLLEIHAALAKETRSAHHGMDLKEALVHAVAAEALQSRIDLINELTTEAKKKRRRKPPQRPIFDFPPEPEPA
jgi:hypothetical protein